MDLPLGFTTISTNYLPLVPAPNLSSLVQESIPVFTASDYTYLPAPTNPITFVSKQTANWLINLDYILLYDVDSSNLTRYPLIKFYCKVFNADTGEPVSAGVPVTVKLIHADANLINIPTSVTSLTSSKGLCTLVTQLNFITEPITLLTFQAYVLPDIQALNNNTNILLTSLAASDTFVKDRSLTLPKEYISSNKVYIQTANASQIVNKSNSFQELNLYNDSVVIQNTIVEESVQQLYNDLSTITTKVDTYISPYETCAASTVEAGLRLVQGFTKNEVCRYSGWGNKVLANVHSHMSAEGNSEVNLIDKTITLNKSTIGFLQNSAISLDRYKQVLETTGQHVIANTSSYLSAQSDQGNNVTTSNVHQVHAQHIRHNSGANYDIHASGKASVVANQVFVNGKWMNLATDTYQQICQHYWLRAEDLLQINGKNTIRYNYSSLQEYSANSLITTGQNINYADVTWNQTGQVNAPPLHPARTEELNHKYNGTNKVAYGTCVNLSMQDYHIVSKYGLVRLRAAQHIKFQSDSGGFLFKAPSGKYKVDTQSVEVKSLKSVKVNSLSKISIKAPFVYINCTTDNFDDYLEADNISNITSNITALATTSDIVGKSLNEAGQVLNDKGQVIAQAVNPYINNRGDIVHSILDKNGNQIGQQLNSLTDRRSVITPVRFPQPAVNQALVYNRENLNVIDNSSYVPMTFSKIEDPIETTKVSGGNTTGQVLQVDGKQFNPNSISPGGPPGSGANSL